MGQLKDFAVRLGIALGLVVTAAPQLALAAEISPELIAKAKQEGQLTYYTELIIDQLVKPMAVAFEKTYGIKVNYVRSDSADTALRLLNEHRANRTTADVFSLTTGMTTLREAGIVRKYAAANAEAIPAAYKDPGGLWVACYMSVLTGSVNTELVAAADRPKSYDDLLDPRWKGGKIAWKPNDTTGAPGFIAAVLLGMGEDNGMAYLRKLSEQKLKVVNLSARAIVDQVMAGEYPLALQTSNHHAEISKSQGAPVDWLRLSPVAIATNQVALTADAPHPNAGLLWAEFLFSKEGAEIFRSAGYLGTRADVPPMNPDLSPQSGKFKAIVLTPDMIAERWNRWNEIFTEVFR